MQVYLSTRPFNWMSAVTVHSCCTFWGQSRLKDTIINKPECTLEFNRDTYLPVINKQPGEREKNKQERRKID